MSLLKLPSVPEWMWSCFQEAPERLRAPRAVMHVLDRWRRSRQLGASAEGPPPDEQVLRGTALRERRERVEQLERAAVPVLERTQGLLAGRGYATLLADGDGVVLRTFADSDFLDEAHRVRLIDGANWSESARGTNAIGTTLAEGTPMVVSGNAHYGRRFHRLVCYAAPILGPSGEVVGAVDASSTTERSDDAVAVAIAAAAQAIEVALRMGAWAKVGEAMMRTLGRSLDRVQDPVLLVEAPGRIARANPAALALFGERAARGTVESALGLRWDELRAEADAGAGSERIVELSDLLIARGRPRRYMLRVDPVETSEHGLIALVVHLEPRPTLAAAPTPARAAPATAPRSDEDADAFAAIFAEDDALRQAVGWARRVARSDVPVMILAETGSGKELFAEAIHRASPRHAGPFLAVNCGAIAPTLIESELFGHGPSAFTGADRRGRDGFFAAASTGTLFLDEVGEMPPSMQASLLRVLEDGRYRRVGEVETRRADVRVVCATCRDLPAMVARGEFRSDLYFRLKGATVALPPLRSRTDRVALARHLLVLLARRRSEPAPQLDEAVEAWIAAQPWPGNVRELKSVLEVALVMAGDRPRLDLSCLPPEPDRQVPHSTTTPVAAAAAGKLDEAEGRALREALLAAGGNISTAAARLGVARSTVYRLMRKHNLAPPT